MQKLKNFGLVLIVMLISFVFCGFDTKETPQIAKSDDYLGFTDNACWVYEGVAEFYDFKRIKSETFCLLIDDFEGVTYFAVTANEYLDDVLKGRTTNYIERVKTDNGFRYYLKQGNRRSLMCDAPLEIGDETPMGRVVAYKDIELPIGKFKAFEIDQGSSGTAWVVPYIGVVKEESLVYGTIFNVELISYTY